MRCSYIRCFIALLWLGIACSLFPGRGAADNQVTVPKVFGVFVDPVPGAPFSATVEIVSKQTLADGSLFVLKTINYIARDSLGRTHNEARRFVSNTYEEEPPVTDVYIYDPVAGLSTHLDPSKLVARQTKTNIPPPPNAKSVPPNPNDPNSPIKQIDLGTRMFKNLTLRGIRQSRSADDYDEYWYSSDLSIYMMRKHHDPIWEQTVNVGEFERLEPDPSNFAIAATYKIAAQIPGPLPQPGPSGLYVVGGEVLGPKLIYAPDPKYPPKARQAKYQGVAVVSVVIDVEGKPQHVQIVRHLDMGLDEAAVSAVQQYKFAPATLRGKPVPVELRVEVNFRIY